MLSWAQRKKETLDASNELEARVATVDEKTEHHNNESLFTEEKPKANNENNSTLDRMGGSNRHGSMDS